ncbi:hypothetical protein GCM10020000_16880 [Streptomyces olivoverticillatus]
MSEMRNCRASVDSPPKATGSPASVRSRCSAARIPPASPMAAPRFTTSKFWKNHNRGWGHCNLALPSHHCHPPVRGVAGRATPSHDANQRLDEAPGNQEDM